MEITIEFIFAPIKKELLDKDRNRIVDREDMNIDSRPT